MALDSRIHPHTKPLGSFSQDMDDLHGYKCFDSKLNPVFDDSNAFFNVLFSFFSELRFQSPQAIDLADHTMVDTYIQGTTTRDYTVEKLLQGTRSPFHVIFSLATYALVSSDAVRFQAGSPLRQRAAAIMMCS